MNLFCVIDTDRIKVYIQQKNKFLFKLNMSKKTSQQNFSLLKSQLVQKLTCQNVNPWENKPVKSSHTSLYLSVCLSVCLFVCVCLSLCLSLSLSCLTCISSDHPAVFKMCIWHFFRSCLSFPFKAKKSLLISWHPWKLIFLKT